MTKNKSKIDQLKKENKNLDEILDEIDNEIEQDKTAVKKIFGNKKKVIAVDFEEIQEECDAEAKELVHQMVGYYLDPMLIDDPYILEKIKTDSSVISKIKFQLKTSEFAAIKLLEQIQMGETFNRNFEVLGGLQRSQMEINKYLVQVQLVFEKNYRDLMDEYNSKRISQSQNQLPNGLDDRQSIGGIGHKQLLSQLNINS